MAIVGRNGLCKLSIDSHSLSCAVVDVVLLGKSNDSALLKQKCQLQTAVYCWEMKNNYAQGQSSPDWELASEVPLPRHRC